MLVLRIFKLKQTFKINKCLYWRYHYLLINIKQVQFKIKHTSVVVFFLSVFEIKLIIRSFSVNKTNVAVSYLFVCWFVIVSEKKTIHPLSVHRKKQKMLIT